MSFLSWLCTSFILGYMIASTNLGITMIIAVYGFLGAIFLKVMIGAAMAFLIVGYILCCICMGDNPVEPAEQQEMMMDKKSRWQAACDFFREDLDMTRKDILVGFIVASAVSVMMPLSWWQMIFWSYQDFGALAWGVEYGNWHYYHGINVWMFNR